MPLGIKFEDPPAEASRYAGGYGRYHRGHTILVKPDEIAELQWVTFSELVKALEFKRGDLDSHVREGRVRYGSVRGVGTLYCWEDVEEVMADAVASVMLRLDL